MDSNSFRAKIKEKLEQVECPVHHEHPEVTITERGVSIKGCCDEFQKQTTEYARIVESIREHLPLI